MTDTLTRPEASAAPPQNGAASTSGPPLRLNLGSGDRPLAGFINVDRKDGGEVYPLTLPLPDGPLRHPCVKWDGSLPDACAAEIRASHVLEHLPKSHSLAVLTEWARVLAPGGWLKVAVPDFDFIVDAYTAWRDSDEEADSPDFEGWLLGGQTDANDHHYALFSRPALAEALRLVGLVDIGPWESEQEDCAALPVSLNLQGRKPRDGEAPAQPEAPEPARYHPPATLPPAVAEPDLRFEPGMVRAVLSAPRLGFTNYFYCAQQTFGALGVGFEVGFGVFWGQVMSRLLAQNLDAELIVTTDYDTLFSRTDLETLLLLMRRYPDADAIVPLQCRREDDKSPLFTTDVGGADPYGTKPREVVISTEDLAGDLFPVASGHFGFSAIRTSALKRLPRPWFHGQPAPDGTWGEGRLDDDVAFWKAWRACGNSLYLAPRLVVGHVQAAAFWPDRNLKPRSQYLGAFDREGKPAWTWR